MRRPSDDGQKLAEKFPDAKDKVKEMVTSLQGWMDENKDHPGFNFARNAADLLLTFGSTFIPALDTKVIGAVKGTQNYTADTLQKINEAFIKAYSKIPDLDSGALNAAQNKLIRAQDMARRATLGSKHLREKVLKDAEEEVSTATRAYDKAISEREKNISNLNNKYQALQQMVMNPTFTSAKNVEETIAEWNK